MKTFSDIPVKKDEHRRLLVGHIRFENGFEMTIKQLYEEEKNKDIVANPGEWFVSVVDQDDNQVSIESIKTLEYHTEQEITLIMREVQEIGKWSPISDIQDQ